MIETTEALYREAVAFYYELLKEREELWDEKSADHPGTSGKAYRSRKRRKRTKVHPAEGGVSPFIFGDLP